jgi:membrane protease YdiL (CAAX protease family)
MLAVAAVFDFGVFSIRTEAWVSVLLQALGYLFTVLPILVCAPRLLQTLRAPRRQLLAAAGLLTLAIVIAVASSMYRHPAQVIVDCLITGLCEELAFRGFIWERLQDAGLQAIPLVAVNVALFTCWHLVSVASNLNQWDSLIGITVYGTIFSIVRMYAGNTALPACVHAAVDIVGL